MVDTLEFLNYLKSKKIDFYAGVPDSLLKELCSCIFKNIKNNFITANEGNALSMCAGYYLSTGKIGVTYMQNSGLGNVVNPLLSLVDPEVYKIPVLMIVGLRGEPGVHDEPQHVKQGKLTIPLLETMEVKYSILDSESDYKKILSEAIKYMKEEEKPYAIVVKKNTFSSYKFENDTSNLPTLSMSREQAIEAITKSLDNDTDFIVSTTGKTSRELFEIREKNKESHSNDFLTVGSMGHTASIAYGAAIGNKKKNIYVLDGDGSLIMHMGSLAVIGSRPVKNFKYIVNVNYSHESVGGQPTCLDKIDVIKILKGCGFRKIFTAKSTDEINNVMPLFKNSNKSCLVLYTKQGSRENLGRPTTTPQENKKMFMEKIK